MQQEIFESATKLGRYLVQQRWKIAVAESCTGGGICQAMTDVAGSSEWFDRGFVTYSNQAKIDMLGVSPDTLDRFGAVSEETVREMLTGTLENSGSNCAIAVSGIAGPGGGTKDKPVGTVFIGWLLKNGICVVERKLFSGDRVAIRAAIVHYALNKMSEILPS